MVDLRLKSYSGFLSKIEIQRILIFIVSLLVLLRTMVPTIYTLDSAELTTGAATLGIVHAPGYPLYLILAHLFTLLPIGDIAFRVNLFSAVCLALTAPILYSALQKLILDRWIALSATLIFMWSYYIWSTGIVAEIYAPQLVTFALVGGLLIRIYKQQVTNLREGLMVGFFVGIMLAVAPSSIFFVPGIAISFVALRISWRICVLSTILSLFVFLLALSYFPIRYTALPPLNLAGEYGSDGIFQPVNLQTINGIWWILRGTQFKSLFFANGYFPSWNALLKTVSWLWGNYLGIGVIFGVIGGYVLYSTKRPVFFVWSIFFWPYMYFYSTYGATDRNTMFGPIYLLWAILLAFGLRWAVQSVTFLPKVLLVSLLPIITLVVNFPIVDSSQDTSIRQHSEIFLKATPPNAEVFGLWWDIAPLQYLQMVEKERSDLMLYNIFLFQTTAFPEYLASHIDHASRPIVVLGSALKDLDISQYSFVPLKDKDSSSLVGGFIITRNHSSVISRFADTDHCSRFGLFRILG